MRRERDMDLFRSLMLEMEDGKTVFETASNETLAILGVSTESAGLSREEADKLQRHLRLIEEAGFVLFTKTGGGVWYVDEVTGPGYDFLDSVRDPKIWAKTKDGALAAGGWTLSLLSDLAKGFARQQIAKHTGIEL